MSGDQSTRKAKLAQLFATNEYMAREPKNHGHDVDDVMKSILDSFKEPHASALKPELDKLTLKLG
jgi:hypothetical protein